MLERHLEKENLKTFIVLIETFLLKVMWSLSIGCFAAFLQWYVSGSCSQKVMSRWSHEKGAGQSGKPEELAIRGYTQQHLVYSLIWVFRTSTTTKKIHLPQTAKKSDLPDCFGGKWDRIQRKEKNIYVVK